MKSKNHLTLAILALSSSLSIGMDPPAWAQEPLIAAKSKKLIKGKIERDVVMADSLLLKGKYAEAAELYRQALSRNTKNVAATAGLGMALGKQFKLDGAMEQFDKALQLDPKNALAHSGKAMVLLNRLQSSSLTVQKSKDSILKQAESEAKQAITIDPTMPEAHFNLGMAYKEQGRLDEAASAFQEAINNDSAYSEAYAQLGMVKLAQNSPAEAEDSFKKAVSYNSGNSTAHYGLGRIYLQQGRVDDALKELNTSLYQYPNSAPVHQTMGEAYQAQGNTVKAIQEYQKSIDIKPENATPYLKIAEIREQRGDLEHSIAELRSGLDLMPDNADLHMAIARQSLQLEKLDDALKEYKTVLNASPQNAEAAKGLTRCYYLKAQKEVTGAFTMSNEYELAEQQIEQAVKMNPNDMELRLAQAKLRALSGKQVDLASIGTPKTDGERIAYAEALLAQNKYKEASDQMSTVLTNATDKKQTFAVADLALMIKDLKTAEAAYKKGATYAGGEDRSKRGLDQVAKARDLARQDLTLADDLARKKQLASAVDKYHSAIFGNPVVPEPHLGLAKALEKMTPLKSSDLREATTQYRAYISLVPNLPQKEQERLTKHLQKLEDKAFKLEKKEKSGR